MTSAPVFKYWPVALTVSLFVAIVVFFAACSSGGGASSPGAGSSDNGAVLLEESSEGDAGSEVATPLSEEQPDDGRVDVYGFDSSSSTAARAVLLQLDAAEEWGSAAVGGDADCAWAYTMALEAVSPERLVDETASWQRSVGAKEVSGSSVAGYAVDGGVIYACFGYVGGETKMSGVFDGNGKLLYLRSTGGDAYDCWAFKDNKLVSHTGGFSDGTIEKPQIIGKRDEGDRSVQQKRLLDIAYGRYSMLRTDAIVAVGATAP